MRRAVVLFNLGGPSSLEEIEPFLQSLFSDPAILSFPGWIRRPLARWIAHQRTPKAQEIYQKIGGKSPLLENTRSQAKALEKVLGEGYKVFVAMRHASPFISEAVVEIKAFQPHEVILLPLYPQFSIVSTGSAFEEWDLQDRLQQLRRTRYHICCYPEMAGFVDAMADLTLKQVALFKNKPRLLFSAHGLPQRIIQQGDPYVHHVERSFKKILKKVNELSGEIFEGSICYQSRVGRGVWTQPSLDTELTRAAQDQVSVLVIPLSFVSEHAETLVELDMDYLEQATALGISEYRRVPTVSCHPAFIQGLAQLVRSKERPLVSCAIGWKKCWRR